MTNLWFHSWTELLRIALVGVFAYAALVALLRGSGKRTLTKMNAFDFVVTIALGSMLASVILSKDVALAEGLLALGLLVGLQYAVTWASVRSSLVRRVVKSEPSLLFYEGRMLEQALRAQRVTQAEVRAAVRASGMGDLQEVEAVVLETDGTFSVIARVQDQVANALSPDVAAYPPDPRST